MTKKKIKNYRYYLFKIKQIEKTRRKNNKNWIDLLRLSFKHNSEATKRIVRDIFIQDKRINQIVKKLLK